VVVARAGDPGFPAEEIEHLVQKPLLAAQRDGDLLAGVHEELVFRVFIRIFAVLDRRAGPVQDAHILHAVQPVMGGDAGMMRARADQIAAVVRIDDVARLNLIALLPPGLQLMVLH